MWIFLWFSWYFYDPADVGNMISGSSAFSKSSSKIWKFSVNVLLKPHLQNSEHYFASVWDECNCAAVWTFFGIVLLWDWNENWPFSVLWPQTGYGPGYFHIELEQTLHHYLFAWQEASITLLRFPILEWLVTQESHIIQKEVSWSFFPPPIRHHH